MNFSIKNIETLLLESNEKAHEDSKCIDCKEDSAKVKGGRWIKQSEIPTLDEIGQPVYMDEENVLLYPLSHDLIIGSTGSGKSSLVNLIPRFYDCTEGEVFVNGVNVKDHKLQDLREKIGIVLQKAELYSRPIEANIRWGKDEATPWEIKNAAEIAQADDFICETEYGYYTNVTEGGHSLSGGQKQRISIARAVLKDPEILIFDDSTSALDLRTEANLYEALKKASPDATKIIIAQRIASVKDADRIAVIENGTIADIGTHEELMENSEYYREIYNSQLKGGVDVE